MKPLAPNVLIQNRYLIVHLIGKGGMGEVYLAVDQRLGSAVALKRTFFSDDEMLATAFEREARILANLRHPILPKVSDHFVEGENQFLVMEHITGDDLSKRLEKTQQAFPLSWVLFWADQLLDALHYLHTHEPPIIHRDIKPQNLKLTNDNHIVLLDFGLSKNSVGETRTSSTGSVVGYTPHYAPMEQIRGTGTNAQSDLYSLSATVYQLLTGTVPPDALTRADSLLSGLPDPLTPISDLNKEVTPEVSEVILKGMDIRQESRHASAREMQKKLRDAYSRLQSAMTAQTIAFNVNEKQNGLDVQAPKPDPVPVEAPLDSQNPIQVGSGDLNYNLLSENKEISYTPDLPEQNQNFDATLKFDQHISDSGLKPSDIKTEVLLAGESSAIKAAQEGKEIPIEDEYIEKQDYQSADKYVDDDYSNEEDFSKSEVFTPGATVPDVSLREKVEEFNDDDDEDDVFAGVGGQGETAFFSGIEVDDQAGAGATFIANRDEFANDEVESKPVVTPVMPPTTKKSSGGKTFAIIGGLFAVFVMLLGGVGGAVWYMNRDSGVVETPSPTPSVSIEVTPSVEPTVDETLNANISNSDNGNVDTNINGQTNNENINGSNVDVNQQQTGRTPTPQIKTPTPQVRTPTPQVRTPTPQVRTPTPQKGTPTPTRRILQ